jgi:hypothetical protein
MLKEIAFKIRIDVTFIGIKSQVKNKNPIHHSNSEIKNTRKIIAQNSILIPDLYNSVLFLQSEYLHSETSWTRQTFFSLVRNVSFFFLG